jgi:hypothetical protein
VPHSPPQPSSPQERPSHFFWQTHLPVPSQALPWAQLPHEHDPLAPHSLAAQSVWQALHRPAGEQLSPGAQLPQLPPQTSSPQALPWQEAVQATHFFEVASQLLPTGQAQVPPQPSAPQPVPSHLGVQEHRPVLASQALPVGQSPQLPPQPSSPQVRPEQAGAQLVAQTPVRLLQTLPASHVPQIPPQPSAPQPLPSHMGTQMHWPVAWLQPVPVSQVPHTPPQPSAPHCLFLQAGLQAVPESGWSTMTGGFPPQAERERQQTSRHRMAVLMGLPWKWKKRAAAR